MKLALMAIGVPGAGKTTVLKPLAEQYGLAYINRDDIREEILGDATDQSANKAVWEEANRRTQIALERDQGVVLDSTFVEEWKRKEMIELLRDEGATHIVGVVCDIPLDVAKERNRLRDRIVPEDVMDTLYAKLVSSPPSLAEGFDALIPLADLENRLAQLTTA